MSFMRSFGQFLGLIDLDVPGIDRSGRLVPPRVSAKTIVSASETETWVQVELTVDGRGLALVDCAGLSAEHFAEAAADKLAPLVFPLVPEAVGSEVLVRDGAGKVLADTPVGLYASRPTFSMSVTMHEVVTVRASWCGIDLEYTEGSSALDLDRLAHQLWRHGIVRSARKRYWSTEIVTHSGERLLVWMPWDLDWWRRRARNHAETLNVIVKVGPA